MYQKLLTDPYNLSFDQIADLTDYQISDILCRPQRKSRPGSRHGTSTPKKYGTYKSWFWSVWQSRGWSEEKIQQRWDGKVARGEVKDG